MTQQHDSHGPGGFDDGMSASASSPFILEVPAFAAQYVEPLSPTGDTAGRSATGFFVRDRGQRTYLVTNRHVVTGRSGQDNVIIDGATSPSALRVSFPMSGPGVRWTQLVLSLGDADWRPLWLEHHELGWQVDVVALPFHLDQNVYDIVTMPMTPSPARLEVTTDLYVLGFPIGFNPVEATGVLAVWTRGTLAWLPRLDWQGRPAMLLDARTRHGQSGSPVIFYRDGLAPYVRTDGTVSTDAVWGLVGVYSGRIHPDSDLGVVWKRSALEDVLSRGVRPQQPLVMPLEVDPSTLVPHVRPSPTTTE